MPRFTPIAATRSPGVRAHRASGTSTPAARLLPRCVTTHATFAPLAPVTAALSDEQRGGAGGSSGA